MSSVINDATVNVGDTIYYAQTLSEVGEYNILEMHVATVYDTYFACTEKRDKHRYLFKYGDVGTCLFYDRKLALEVVNKAESQGKKVSNKKYYEED